MLNCLFQKDRGKTTSAARILSPNPTRRPLPCLLIQSFFYMLLCQCCGAEAALAGFLPGAGDNFYNFDILQPRIKSVEGKWGKMFGLELKGFNGQELEPNEKGPAPSPQHCFFGWSFWAEPLQSMRVRSAFSTNDAECFCDQGWGWTQTRDCCNSLIFLFLSRQHLLMP